MSDATHFAHSTTTPDRSDWEGLRAHLEAVADRAAGFARNFDAADLGRAAGLLHDVGKYADRFQAYIRDDGASVDHATAGARLAVERYPGPLGKILAFCVAGHHAGLANGQNGKTLSSLDERLRKTIEDYSAWRLELTLAASLLPPTLDVNENRRGFQLAFFTRMLFSCLVDADFLETGRFYAGVEERTPARDAWPGLAALKPRLDAHLAGKAANVEATPVNRQRARVLAAAREGAALAPGLFSLTVPTGGGKTLASLAFALDHARRHGQRRVVYVIPFTSIVEQTAAVFRAALGDDAVLEHHSAFDVDERRRREDDEEERDGAEKLRLAAENWDAPVVVTTAVQFFESLFSSRGSRCRKLHNIANSVVVLDEAQTLPLKLLRPCVAAIDELARNYKTSVVLCTATQPALNAPAFEDGLENVRELAPAGLFADPAFRRVRVEPAGALDDADLAARLKAEPRALCVVNSRKHALDLFGAIRDAEGAVHLSTLMCAAHRRQALATIRERLKAKLPVRLVSTSLIEAGVDISFPVVLRAGAGLDSIAQAAGRCNREGELDGLGRVVVFEAPGWEPPPEVRQLTDAGREILRLYKDKDPLSEEAVRDFFRLTYLHRGDGLDAKHLLRDINERARCLDFPFETVAATFRMIESVMVPVIIPYDGKARGLLDALEHVSKPGGVARKLQPYVAQVPRSARGALLASGAVRHVREPEFGDQFARLENTSLYREATGLAWDDPTFLEGEKLVL